MREIVKIGKKTALAALMLDAMLREEHTRTSFFSVSFGVAKCEPESEIIVGAILILRGVTRDRRQFGASAYMREDAETGEFLPALGSVHFTVAHWKEREATISMMRTPKMYQADWFREKLCL